MKVGAGAGAGRAVAPRAKMAQRRYEETMMSLNMMLRRRIRRGKVDKKAKDKKTKTKDDPKAKKQRYPNIQFQTL